MAMEFNDDNNNNNSNNNNNHDSNKILENAEENFNKKFLFNNKKTKKDSGYAWIILIASLITLTINWGLILCFGIYFITLLEYFQCSRRDVATVGALAYGVLCFAGPLVTILEKRYGARTIIMIGSVISSIGMVSTYFAQSLWHVYIGFGVVGGLGCSFMYIPCFAILPEYFDKYQHFATSFATVGSAVGNLILSAVLYNTIEYFTWRGSMLINAGLLLQCVVCGALMKSNNNYIYDKTERMDNYDKNNTLVYQSPSTNKHLFKEMKYIMFLVECFCYGGSSYVVFSMINELIVEHGLSVADSARLVSIIGAFNIIGRVAASLITHCQCTDRPLFFALATAFFTFSIFTTTQCYQFSTFAASLAIFGLTYGVKTSQIAAVLIDLFGIERMTVGMAYGVLCSGLGGFIVPPLAAWLADVVSTESSFLLAAAFSCVALGSCVTIVFLHKYHTAKDAPRSDIAGA